jgi:hypothetical protein
MVFLPGVTINPFWGFIDTYISVFVTYAVANCDLSLIIFKISTELFNVLKTKGLNLFLITPDLKFTLSEIQIGANVYACGPMHCQITDRQPKTERLIVFSSVSLIHTFISLNEG